MLLYLGLNKNPEYVDTILKQLIRNFETSMKTGTEPDIILFSALVQCVVPDPETAQDIINLAREFLITGKNPVKEVVEELEGGIRCQANTDTKTTKDVLVHDLGRNFPL